MRQGGVLRVFFFFYQTFTYISEVVICPINAGEIVKILGLCNRLYLFQSCHLLVLQIVFISRIYTKLVGIQVYLLYF